MKKLIICSILLLSSILVAVGAGYFYFATKSFLEKAQTTEGTVIELIKKKSSDGKSTYAPVFTYKDSDNLEHKIYSTTSSYPPAYEVNEKVEIFYLPTDPKQAKINGFFQLWGASVIFAGMSIVTFILTLAFFFFMKPTRR